MTYAYLIDGLDAEGRAKIDEALEAAQPKKKVQAQREKSALAMIMGLPRGAAAT